MTTIRDHYVYRAYDADGRLLYVGCTKRLELRQKEHRTESNWMHLAERFTVAGPFTYEVARRKESEELAAGRPLYAFHPARQTYVAARHRLYRALHAIALDLVGDFWEAHRIAEDQVDKAIPYPGNRAAFDLTDDMLRDALRASAPTREAAA